MRIWRYGVIRLLRQHHDTLVLPDELAQQIPHQLAWLRFLNQQYQRHWNVHIAKQTTHKRQTQNYIGRYLKKPPIAASRLKHFYDGDVTFEYLDHRDKRHKHITISQQEMILRLLSHIPEKHFKMVCYYGFLSNRVRGKYLPILYQKLGQKLACIKPITFTTMMKAMLRTDPFQCILCGARMRFVSSKSAKPMFETISHIRNIALGRLI